MYKIHLTIAQAILTLSIILGLLYAIHRSSEHLTHTTNPIVYDRQG